MTAAEEAAWPAYDAAIEYLDAGWTPTPLRGKVPIKKKWVGLRPSRADCWSWWVEDGWDGVGVVCGAASANLLVVDIEDRLVKDPERFSRVLDRAGELEVWHLIEGAFKTACASTPSGGLHIFFRLTDTDQVPASEKLAFEGSGNDAILLVETRGEGGQVAAPPAGGRRWISGAPGVAYEVTAAQLEAILTAFKSIDEDTRKLHPPTERKPYNPDQEREPSVADAWIGPLLEGAITWADILDPGWTRTGWDDDGRSLWVRPDYGNKSKSQCSAKGFETYTGGAVPVFVVHSTSVPHLPHGSEQRLTPARVWAHCYFDGDEAAANAALEQLATTGEADERIVAPIPTAVLDEARAIVARKTPRTPVANLAPFVPTTVDPDWWEARPALEHIRQHARARMVSPDALLAITLVRLCVAVPYTVKIPPIVGGAASLNLFAALVGPSGAGKSAATAASDELLPNAEPWVHVGSGEGLLHTFVQRTMVKDHPDQPARPLIHQHTHAAAGIVDEVDTLTALGNRQGATLLPTLRSMWSGASVGFGYADPTKRLSLKAHTYRLGLIIGAQPTRCAALFDDTDAGTPQRILWASLVDPGAPDVPPESPGPLNWQLPKELRGLNPQLTVTDTITNLVVQRRREVLRTGETDGLDGHAMLNRIKVAAMLCIIDGRAHVTDDDWMIAGHIQASSDDVRAWVQTTLEAERADMVKRRASIEARVAATVDEERQKARVARLVPRVAKMAAAAEGGRITLGSIRKRVNSSDREVLAEVIEEAERRRLIDAVSWVNPSNGQTVEGVQVVGR